MYVYGKNTVCEYLKKNKKVQKAYIYDNFKDKFLISDLQKRDICIKYLSKIELDKLVKGNHQGIILSVPDYKYFDIDFIMDKDDAFIVILDHLEDPHNFGAIIRTCEAAGVDLIVIPKDRSVDISDTVMRVSTGALENIKVSQVTNLNSTIEKLKKNGFWIIGTDMQGEDYDKIDYKGKIGIIIGNEGHGMSKLVKESCDFIASIPMQGKVNSLNASVATAIVVFEAVKNRK